MRLPPHSVSQAIPKLYFFIARYLKGEIVQNLLTYLKNNNNNTDSSKKVVGILAILKACIWNIKSTCLPLVSYWTRKRATKTLQWTMASHRYKLFN